MENEQNPRTTRDALIIELLGDVGAIHDEIKRLPNGLKESLRGSLELIANAVEEAERTAQTLKTETEKTLTEVSTFQKEKFENDTREVIRKTFSDAIGQELNKTAEVAKNVQLTLEKFPATFGNQYKRLCNYLIAAIFLILVVAGGSAYALYSQAKSWEQRSVGIFTAYQEQQKIILTLPPDVQKKFIR